MKETEGTPMLGGLSGIKENHLEKTEGTHM